MKQYANLHFHSTHSDGTYTLEKLVSLAKEEGYRALAVTDHDTATGNAPLKKLAQAEGMETIFGTEFSTSSRPFGTGFHITAYHYDPEYPPMADYLRKMSYNETHQTEVLFRRGKELGALDGIEWEDVLAENPGVTWLCNEHVFRTLKSKGLRKDSDYPEFFNTLYGVHRGEVPNEYPFKIPQDLIKLIRDAGGIAILAHPHCQLKYLPELVGCGLSGTEVWHSLVSVDERLEALDYAIENGLYISGGSDHEGLMGGEYERYPDDPMHGGFYFEPCTLGTPKLFYEEIRDRKLAPKEQRQAIADAYKAEISGT